MMNKKYTNKVIKIIQIVNYYDYCYHFYVLVIAWCCIEGVDKKGYIRG